MGKLISEQLNLLEDRDRPQDSSDRDLAPQPPSESLAVNLERSKVDRQTRWIETKHVTSKGKTYVYQQERWRDQQGQRRSRYIGKVKSIQPQDHAD